jgi:UDP-N-acetylglucosamine 2-epimerase (non-hydrolysing)
MRNALERPEAMDSGHIVLTGLDPDAILRAVRFVTTEGLSGRNQPIASAYHVSNTSHRVVKLILGTARLGHVWDGILSPLAA